MKVTEGMKELEIKKKKKERKKEKKGWITPQQ